MARLPVQSCRCAVDAEFPLLKQAATAGESVLTKRRRAVLEREKFLVTNLASRRISEG